MSTHPKAMSCSQRADKSALLASCIEMHYSGLWPAARAWGHNNAIVLFLTTNHLKHVCPQNREIST